MHELSDPGHLGDPPVAERRQIMDGLVHGDGVVVPHRRQRSVERADDDRGEAQADETVHPGIVDAKIDHHHAVDPALGPPAAVDAHLLVDVVDELEGQPDGMSRQLRLDAGDELHEERLESEHPRRARNHQAARVGTCRGERPRGTVRIPAELVRDCENTRARPIRHARLPVQCVGDRSLRHARTLGDVADRDSRNATGFLRHRISSRTDHTFAHGSRRRTTGSVTS